MFYFKHCQIFGYIHRDLSLNIRIIIIYNVCYSFNNKENFITQITLKDGRPLSPPPSSLIFPEFMSLTYFSNELHMNLYFYECLPNYIRQFNAYRENFWDLICWIQTKLGVGVVWSLERTPPFLVVQQILIKTQGRVQKLI